jgi:hypothetical protein
MTNFIKNLRGGISVKEIFDEKNYYSIELRKIASLITFNLDKTKIYGSYGYRGLEYAGDIDMFEVVDVKNMKVFIKRLQDKIKAIMKSTNIFFTDIKIGEDLRFQVIDKTAYADSNRKIHGYNYEESLEKLTNLHKNKYITNKEFKKGKELLKKESSIQPLELLQINKKLRFEVLRWTPKDILNGYLKYRGVKIGLEEALRSDGLFKMDFIADVNDLFYEISNIYDLRINGKRISRYPLREDLTLINDFLTFSDEGKYYKSLKRLFTFYHYKYRLGKTDKDVKDSEDMILKIFKILDSDIGKLAQVRSSVEALISLINNAHYIDNKRIKAVIDKMIPRLNNVATIPVYKKNEATFMRMIEDAYNAKTPKKMAEILEILKNQLSKIIDTEAYLAVKKNKSLKLKKAVKAKKG